MAASSIAQHPTHSPVTLLTYGPLLRSFGGMQIRTCAIAAALRRLKVPHEILAAGPISQIDKDDPEALPSLVIGQFPGILSFLRAVPRILKNKTFIFTSALFAPFAIVAWVFHKHIIYDSVACEYLGNRDAASSGGPDATMRRFISYAWFLLEAVSGFIANVVIVTSERDRADWASTYPFLAGKLLILSHAALPLAEDRSGDAASLLSRMELSPNSYVLFVGTMVAKHNRAAMQILAKNAEMLDALAARGVEVVFAGDGTDTTSWPTGVRGVGRVHLANLAVLMANANCCLAPLPYANGTVTKVVDYLRYGKKVVLSPESARGFTFDAKWPVKVTPIERFGEAVVKTVDETDSDEAVESMHNAARLAPESGTFDQTIAHIIGSYAAK